MYRHVRRCITPSPRHTRGYYTLYRIHIFCDIPRDPIIIFSNGWLNTSYMHVNLRSTACIVVESRGLSAQRFPTPNVARATLPSYRFSSSRYRYPRYAWRLFTRSPEHASPSKLDWHNESCSSGPDERWTLYIIIIYSVDNT